VKNYPDTPESLGNVKDLINGYTIQVYPDSYNDDTFTGAIFLVINATSIIDYDT
jgi:hypothetical protein